MNELNTRKISLPDYYLDWLGNQDTSGIFIYDHEEICIFSEKEFFDSVTVNETSILVYKLFATFIKSEINKRKVDHLKSNTNEIFDHARIEQCITIGETCSELLVTDPSNNFTLWYYSEGSDELISLEHDLESFIKIGKMIDDY